MMIKIDLYFPLQTPNGTITSITLNRPKVKDMRLAQKVAGGKSGIEEDCALFARIAQEKLVPEDLEELDLADYAKLQEAFQSMLKDIPNVVELRDDTGGSGVTSEVVSVPAV